MTGLRDTGRHSGNPARETKTFLDAPIAIAWEDVVSANLTPDDIYRWGVKDGKRGAETLRKADYLVVLFILAVGFTVGAVFVGFLR